MPADPATPVLLKLNALTKSYVTRVLDNVDFDLHPGEVHALVGENGAGKSTLARIIAGLTPPDSGTMELQGRAYAPKNKRDAEHHGVRIVMQELNLIGNLSVAENVLFDEIPRRWGWVNYDELNARAKALLAEVGLGDVNPNTPVRSLGIAQQQLVEIAAGLARRCSVLILDEPTAALTVTEAERLFAQIEKLTAAGTAIIYISHRLEEIQRLAHRITVLRDGKIVVTRPARELPLNQVVSFMVGRELEDSAPYAARRWGAPALRVQGLCSGALVQHVSFEVREGEILGIAGLMGSGRTETLRAIFGADRPTAGVIYVGQSAEPARIRQPRDAVQLGIALLTEDRKAQGLLLPLPIRANMTLTRLRSVSRLGSCIDTEAEAAEAGRWRERLHLRCRSTEQTVLELSGGNQQKVVLAKWLFRDCRVLMFDEPTRGIDVGAKFEIYQLLSTLAEQGKAVLVVSSDLKELLAICDRLLVMSAGKVAGNFARGAWSQEAIMEAALSGYRR